MTSDPDQPGLSHLYTTISERVVGACEYVLEEYVTEAAVRFVPELLDVLRSSHAALFAEAAALEALALLGERRGEILDLYFAALYDSEQFEILTPAMPDLVTFLRARLAGQDPVLRLPGDTLPIGLTLLLIAGQALVEAGDDPTQMLACLDQRLKHSPTELRVPPGDLSYALHDAPDLPPERYLRDQLRRVMTGAVPLTSAAVDPTGGKVLLVVDLAARPDVRDLLRILDTEPPPGGASTNTAWSIFTTDTTAVVRLAIDWLEPVPVRLALAFDYDEHREVLRAAARTDHVLLSPRHPADAALDEQATCLRVPINGPSLKQLLAHVTARRRRPGGR